MAESQKDTTLQAPAGLVEAGFQPYQSPYLDNPNPFYAQARQEKPIFFSPMMNMWVVTRYDDLITILKDSQRFSSRNWLSNSARLSPETMRILQGTMFTSESGGLVMADPPVHTRLRHALTNAFSSHLVQQLEDQIRYLANKLIDGFPKQGQIDFVERFGRLLPVQVLCRLIGIPDKDGDWVRKSCDEVEILFIQTLPEDEQEAKAQAYIDLFNYLRDLLEERKVSPRDDLASALQDTSDGTLSIAELVELLITLLTAGIGTSTHFIPGALLILLQENTWEVLDIRPEALSQVVEETLRLVSPIQGLFRMTTQEVEVGGVTIPAKALIYGLVASGNRDESHFHNPDAFEPEREKSGHNMVFGHGIHYCVGAPVVKLEARVALEVLHQRFPHLHLAPNQPPLRYLPGLLLRGLASLPIELE